MVIAVLPQILTKRRQPSAGTAVVSREDVNRDGEVDILDAFALAKELKSGHPPGPGLDINGDGVVDEKDVATIAARAVRLDKGSRS